MEINIGSRVKKAWNAFFNRDPTQNIYQSGIGYSSYRPDRRRLRRGGEKTIVNSIYNRIALDVSLYNVQHVKVDSDDRFLNVYKSSLNECFSISANKDQTGRALLQDAVFSMLDEGCVAIVPIDTSADPELTDSYEIYSMRVGLITEWKPDAVRVKVYNDRKGCQEELWFLKRNVCILENPFYTVMNEPNSTMQRLIRKLNLLDSVDEQTSSGKLDIIIQVPYTTKHPVKKQYAEQRRSELEQQLEGSKYGVGYIDASEHVIQLNRAVENNLLKQVEYLSSQALSQLGMTEEILNGTADEKTMQNYYYRIVEVILTTITEEMRRKFLSKTARSQGQSVMFFRDVLKSLSITSLADVINSLKRNEVTSSNEIRQGIGMKPSKDAKADKLQNSNMPQPSEKEENKTLNEKEDL